MRDEGVVKNSLKGQKGDGLGDDKVYSNQEAAQRMQLKSFTAWVNLQLAKVSLKVNDLRTELEDGILLLKLVEAISGEELGKYDKNPMGKFQKIENLNIPLKYINSFNASIGIKTSYSAEDIYEGNVTLILGMVWCLILRYSVAEISEGDLTAKEGLLLWAQKKVAEGSGAKAELKPFDPSQVLSGESVSGRVEVKNFHNSWSSGMAFCALISAYNPALLDFGALDAKNKLDNLKLAFSLAESQMGIPCFLDADDMISVRPDEKSVMTYVSLFWKKFADLKTKTMAAERIASVLDREGEHERIQEEYAAQAKALVQWMRAEAARFAAVQASPTSETLEAMEGEMRGYFATYQAEEKQAKHKELLDVQALFASIGTRLATVGRSFQPPEEVSIGSIERWWEELERTEKEYEGAMLLRLKNLKKMENLCALFDSKAGKFEQWAASKEQWLAASRASLQEASKARVAPPAHFTGHSLGRRASFGQTPRSPTKPSQASYAPNYSGQHAAPDAAAPDAAATAAAAAELLADELLADELPARR